MNKIFVLSWIILILLATVSCSSPSFEFSGEKVIERGRDLDGKVSFGVISDIHGQAKKARIMAQELKNRGVDAFILPGDLGCNNEISNRCANTPADKEEIKSSIEAVAAAGLPVFVIPGNHESKQDYDAAMEAAQQSYPNIIDMTKYRVVDGLVADIISLPGYSFQSGMVQVKERDGVIDITAAKFIPTNGFLIHDEDISSLNQYRQGLDDPIILVTHAGGKTNASKSPTTTFEGTDVGDERITYAMKEQNISFAVVGHIHEAGGLAVTVDGAPVSQGEWAFQFTANFGTLEPWIYLDGKARKGMAGILTIEGDKGKFEMVEIE